MTKTGRAFPFQQSCSLQLAEFVRDRGAPSMRRPNASGRYPTHHFKAHPARAFFGGGAIANRELRWRARQSRLFT